jgi:Asp-tRNA(Asn)/Glu-tRNA(Gln) amidotransferase B subunit
MRSELPELPEARRNRYRNDYGIKDEDIEVYINDSKYLVLSLKIPLKF